MAHDHEHDQHAHPAAAGDHHDHQHGPTSYGRAFAIGISLNIAIVVIEVIYGLLSHSMALVADAGHNTGDVLGLALAWGATVLAKRTPSTKRTYGLRRMSILVALANAVVLLVATGGVGWEAIRRLGDPGTVDARTVMVVAAIAVAINGASALLFIAGSKHDLNIRGAFLHLAGDAAIALGVVASGGVILATGWTVVDPIVSLVVSALVLLTTWSVLRRSLDLALDAVPEHIDAEKVRIYLTTLPGVSEVHDLHIWAMSTTETALTAHLVSARSDDPQFLGGVCKELRVKFRIEHATLQIEPPNGDLCRQAPEGAL